jgi:hypothetical protein
MTLDDSPRGIAKKAYAARQDARIVVNWGSATHARTPDTLAMPVHHRTRVDKKKKNVGRCCSTHGSSAAETFPLVIICHCVSSLGHPQEHVRPSSARRHGQKDAQCGRVCQEEVLFCAQLINEDSVNGHPRPPLDSRVALDRSLGVARTCSNAASATARSASLDRRHHCVDQMVR